VSNRQCSLYKVTAYAIWLLVGVRIRELPFTTVFNCHLVANEDSVDC